MMYGKFLAHNRHLINGSSSYYFKNPMNRDNRSLLMLKQRELNIYIEHTRASLYLSAFHHTHDNPEG